MINLIFNRIQGNTFNKIFWGTTYMSQTKEDEIFELEKRRIIYNFVLNNPGMHLREISRKLNIPKTTLDYHLSYLRRKNLLVCKTEGKCNRYFAQYKIGSIDQKVLTILRQKIPRGIIILTFITDELYKSEFSTCLQIPITTISYHLKKLKKRDILEMRIKRGKSVYSLKNRNYIYDFFIRFKNCLSDDSTFTDFIFIMKNFMLKGNAIVENKDIKDKHCNKAYNLFRELFPIPFCA